MFGCFYNISIVLACLHILVLNDFPHSHQYQNNYRIIYIGHLQKLIKLKCSERSEIEKSYIEIKIPLPVVNIIVNKIKICTHLIES